MTGSRTVNTDELSAFERDGHILLRSVASEDEVDRYRPAIRDACLRFNTESRSLDERDTYGKAFLQTTNLWRRDDLVKEFVLNSRFASIAAGLLGVERVRLYHDQALFKEPGGGRTPWHQDQYYWPLDTDRTITMWMPLVNIDAEMGMITFASGSHRSPPVGDIAISDTSEAELSHYVDDGGFEISQTGSMSAGDATFHLGLTVHSAGGNQTSTLREVMTIIYFADGAAVTEPANEHQAADLAAWLDARRAGQPADGPLNPIIS